MSDTNIDEAIKKYHCDCCEGLCKECFNVEPNNTAQAKSALYDLILKEVVGEDVPFSLAREMELGEFDMSARKLESQNSLRASQRNKLKQLFERSDNE